MTAKFAALTLVAVLGWSGSVHAAGTAEAGQAKSATCMACHGMDGNSANPEWPILAGQHPSYIVKQLKHFKAGERQNPLMSPMAMILSDQDMEDLAAYFSSQKLRGHGRDRAVQARARPAIFRAGIPARGVPSCSGCHGPGGAGIAGAAFPADRRPARRLRGAQLRGYKSGTRATDPNSMMRTIASRLTDEEIDAVASYLQGMR